MKDEYLYCLIVFVLGIGGSLIFGDTENTISYGIIALLLIGAFCGYLVFYKIKGNEDSELRTTLAVICGVLTFGASISIALIPYLTLVLGIILILSALVLIMYEIIRRKKERNSRK